ncbi:hypothetical protein ES703_104096 [subsurface metagenome]
MPKSNTRRIIHVQSNPASAPPGTQRKRQKEHQQLIEELKRGDRVITAGGVYGVIETVSEDSVVIKVESGATMRVAKNSVALKREG